MVSEPINPEMLPTVTTPGFVVPLYTLVAIVVPEIVNALGAIVKLLVIVGAALYVEFPA